MNHVTKSAVAFASLLAITGTTYAVHQAVTIGAEEPNPIIEQVGDHEVRIDSLEGRADQTEPKVAQSAADIQVIQQETGVAPAPTVSSGTQTTSGTTNTSTLATPTTEPVSPTPAPEPPKNPRLITGVSDTPSTPGMHACDYTLYDPAQNVTAFVQPVESTCYSVGEVLPYV